MTPSSPHSLVPTLQPPTFITPTTAPPAAKGFTWQALNTLCWAIGSISGSMQVWGGALTHRGSVYLPNEAVHLH